MSKSGSSKADGKGGDGDSIKVFIRVRPPYEQEGEPDLGCCLTADPSQNVIIMKSKPEPKAYRFDQVSDTDTTQEAMFSSAGKRLIECCMQGYNATIFAYGQTGSGKTFTMVGPSEDSDNFTHELRGLIPRSFEYLFSLINRQKELAGDRLKFLCKCSFLEIYNEQVFDLLDPGSRGLNLRENIKQGVFVDGLQEQAVTSAGEAYEVLQTGWINRRVASTSMNRESSRSHAVFTLQVESKENKGGIWQVRTSYLNLVDLAGSERQKDTMTAGLRLKEGCSINRSLSALGNVIMALVDISNDKTRHVPYRDSKLTFLLRDSLGGNAKTHIIACVHPAHKCFGETLSTLQFARRAKMIKNKAIVNEDVQGDVNALRDQVQRLQREIALIRQGQISPAVDTEALIQGENKNSGTEDGAEWKKKFLEAMYFYERSITQTKVTDEKCVHLEVLLKRKETALKQTKLILRFRDEGLKKLEKTLKSNKEEDTEDVVLSLRGEIKVLEERNADKHEVSQLSIEKRQMQEEINWLRGQLSGCESRESELKQLFETMSAEEREQEVKPRTLTPQTSAENTVSVGTIERHKSQIAKLQDEIKTVKRERTADVEKLQTTVKELEAELAAARAGKEEVEKMLKMTQQRAAIERLNEDRLHMDTIKTITTPKKAKYNLRNRLVVAAGSGSSVVNMSASLNESIVEEDEELSLTDEKMPAELHEEQIQGLTEEIEGLRRDNANLRKELEDFDRKTVELVEEKSRLEQRVASEQQRLEDWDRDRETTQKERDTLNEETQLLKSEVQDLQVMSKQSDTQMTELKQERDLYKVERDNLEGQVFSLSQQFEMIQKEVSGLAVDLTNAKSELETRQTELAFTEDSVHQLELRLQEERKCHQTTQDELKAAQLHLDQEFSRNEQLCCQLKEQGTEREQELLRLMEEKKTLQAQTEMLEVQIKEAFGQSREAEDKLAKSQAYLAQREKEKKEAEDMMSGMASERNQLREEKKKLQSDLESTKSHVEEVHKEMEQNKRDKEEELANVQSKKDEISLQLDKLTMSYDMQQEDLEAMAATNQELEEQNQKLENKGKDIEKQCEDLQQKLSKLEEENSKLTDEVSTSYSKVAAQEDLECRVIELSQDLRDSRSDIRILTGQLRDMETTAAEHLEEKIRLEKKATDEARNVQTWKEMALNQQAVVQSLETKCNNMEFTMKSHEVEISMKSKELEEAKRISSRATSLEEKVNQMTTAQDQVLVLVTDRDSKITDLNQQIERLMTIAERDQEEKSDLRSSLEEQLEKIHRLEKEIKDWKERFHQEQLQTAKLAGHQNHNQKIHHLQSLKEQNSKLCEELTKKDKRILLLEKDLRQRDNVLRQHNLHDNVLTPQKLNISFSSSTPLRSAPIITTVTPCRSPAVTSGDIGRTLTTPARSTSGDTARTLTTPARSTSGDTGHTLTTPARSTSGDTAHTLTTPARSTSGDTARTLTTPARSTSGDTAHTLTTPARSTSGDTARTTPARSTLSSGMTTPNQKKPVFSQSASKVLKENQKPEAL